MKCEATACTQRRDLASTFLSALFILWIGTSSLLLAAETVPVWEIYTPKGHLGFDLQRQQLMATNGIIVRYGDSVLVADSAWLDQNSGEVQAEGNVRIYYGQQIWAAESVRYNFKTRQMETRQFRTGKFPVFVYAEGLVTDPTNNVYIATNALITTDDVDSPYTYVRARYIKIVPGDRLVAHDATLYIGGVPVLFTPYYSRKLDPRSSHFSVTPGYRSTFGPFLLGSYNWVINPEWDASLKLDYRLKRGIGSGADINWESLHAGRFSAGYYYLHDTDPEQDPTGITYDADRHSAYANLILTLATNTETRAAISYQSDSGVLREYFESLYRENPKPPTYLEAIRSWENFTLGADAYVRLNDFQETVERLPEIRLAAYRQRIGNTPLYYESVSSLGYLRRRFAETNGPVLPWYGATRADTFHQLVAPQKLFGFLNVEPRIGQRVTWYSRADGPGAGTTEQWRAVFNTGAEINFKLWRTWPNVTNRLFQLEGLRHVILPSVNYVFVPDPNRSPSQLPQFDYHIATLLPTPIDFPDYSAIDSIDSQHTIRMGLANTLQTKRQGKVEDFFRWNLVIDLRLDPAPDQDTVSDVYSSTLLALRPWLKLYSDLRFDPNQSRFNLVRETLLVLPGERWAWSVTYYYLRDDLNPWPTGWGAGTHVVNNTVEYRFDENWAFKVAHYFDLDTGELKEHTYGVQRDLRSWTASFTFRVRDTYLGRRDYGVSVMLSLKAWPRTRPESQFASPYAGT